MRSVALRLAASIVHPNVFRIILVPSIIVWSAATCSSGELLFFRATENSEQYAKDPARYDRVSFSSTPGGDTSVVYVERQPTLRARLSDITSVTVVKERFYKTKSLEEAVLEALGKKDKDTSEEGVQYYYDATFTLRPNAGREVAKLSQRYRGEPFDLRLGSDRLSIVVFTRPRKSMKTLTFSLVETDPQSIRVILSPIKGRVTWK